MNKKTVSVILTMVCLLLTNLSNGQKRKYKSRGRNSQAVEFMHSLGATYMYAITDESINGAIAVTYAPRLNLIELSKESKVGVSTNLSLGFQLDANSSSSQSSFAYELPVSLDYNFGHGSGSNSRQNFGGFVGAGYAYNSIKNTYIDYQSDFENSTSIHGPYFNGGVRFKNKLDKTYGVDLYTILGNNNALIVGLRIKIGL